MTGKQLTLASEFSRLTECEQGARVEPASSLRWMLDGLHQGRAPRASWQSTNAWEKEKLVRVARILRGLHKDGKTREEHLFGTVPEINPCNNLRNIWNYQSIHLTTYKIKGYYSRATPRDARKPALPRWDGAQFEVWRPLYDRGTPLWRAKITNSRAEYRHSHTGGTTSCADENRHLPHAATFQ